MDSSITMGHDGVIGRKRDAAMVGAGDSRAVWFAAGVAVPALVMLVLSFLPWFQLAVEGTDLGSVLPTEKTGWDTALGLLAVLAALIAGVLALVPHAAARGLYLGPAVAAGVLALLQLAIVPGETVLGEAIPYERTPWVAVAAAAAVVQAVVAVLAVAGSSHRRQEQVR